MAAMPQRGGSREREGKPTGRKKFFVRRRKVCKFCAEKLEYVDWKDVKIEQETLDVLKADDTLNRVYVNGFAKLPVGKARYGVMPSWGFAAPGAKPRLTEDQIRAVAVYVHSLGGGE